MSDRNKRNPIFAPNEYEESLLKALNNILNESKFESYLENNQRVELPPIVFISFVPRSGSTYLAQLLARSSKFHYVSNFVARFWMCPNVGFFLQNVTGLADITNKEEQFNSLYGVTSHPLDPHEFGFFWKQFITGRKNDYVYKPYDSSLVKNLRTILNNIRTCSNKPMFIKNGLAGYNVEYIRHCFPEAKFIHVKRDSGEVVRSIHKGRKEIFNDYSEWLSIKPKNIAELQVLNNPHDQILGQVESIDHHISSAFIETNADFIQIDYSDIVREPQEKVEEIYSFVMKSEVS